MHKNKNIQTFGVVIKAPITKSDRITFVCHSAKIQNAGTTIISLGPGWTIYPGGNLTIGNHTNSNLLLDNVLVSFGTISQVQGELPTNKLEIIEYHLHDGEQAHYDG